MLTKFLFNQTKLRLNYSCTPPPPEGETFDGRADPELLVDVLADLTDLHIGLYIRR